MNCCHPDIIDKIFETLVSLATKDQENMYFTYQELRSQGEDRPPTTAEAVAHFLKHDGYKKTLLHLGIQEFKVTTDIRPEVRCPLQVHSD